MLEVLFYFGKEIVLITINGKTVMFGNTSFGSRLATIDGLKLNYSGVIKEFPDLKDNPLWREEAIKRFKAHCESLPNEDAIANYVIEDLKKYGYQPKFKQRQGFRPEAIK